MIWKYYNLFIPDKQAVFADREPKTKIKHQKTKIKAKKSKDISLIL